MTIPASASPCLELPDSDALLPAGVSMRVLVVPFVAAMVGLKAITMQKLEATHQEMRLN